MTIKINIKNILIFISHSLLCVCVCVWPPWWLSGEEPACNAGDVSLIRVSGRLPGKGNGYPRWCSCLGNPMDRGTWPATVHEVAKSQTRISYQTTVTVLSLHAVLNCLFACLSLAELDLCWCTRAFSSRGERGLLFWWPQASGCGGSSCCRVQEEPSALRLQQSRLTGPRAQA